MLLLLLTLFTVQNTVTGQVFLISIRADGPTDICQGESVTARLSVYGGSPPYTVTISDSDGVYTVLEDIYMPHEFEIYPDKDNTYYISEALDSKDRKGRAYGSVEVEVTPAPPVSIILDRTAYLESEQGVDLVSDPPGGVFSGPGVSRNTFFPSVATTEGSPHQITCTYTTDEGCISTDTELLYVLSGESRVGLYDGDELITSFCSNGSDYTIIGSNEDNLNGSFQLFRAGSSTPLEGYISDADPGDNMATLQPAGLTGNYEIVYTYGTGGLEIDASSQFTVLEGGATGIANLPENVCKNDEPYPLLPEVNGEDPGATYSFSGPGVSGSQTDGFFFDPGDQEVSAGMLEIELEYTSTNGCQSRLSQLISVEFNPEPLFTLSPVCLPVQGGTVSFENLTPMKGSVESWNWNFGDPGSGGNNTSTLENPDHFYSGPGSITITLTATTSGGCQGFTGLDTLLVDSPPADFTISTNCYAPDRPILFQAAAGSLQTDLDTLIWRIRTLTGSLVDEIGSSPDDLSLAYTFPSLDPYQVFLHMENVAGCTGETSREIDLQPLEVLGPGGYDESFDQAAAGWGVSSSGGLESWVLDVPDFEGFEPVSGDRAWVTDLPEYNQGTIEHSWVTSPCFDLSGLRNPVVELDIMKSFEPGKGGAVLQYREAMAESWTTLGTPEGGTNWYNQTGIAYMPGGSSTGWGLASFEPDKSWVTADYPFDLQSGTGHFIFRVAFASGGRKEITPGRFNQGFAFDNFAIRESMRRRSVLEYFTNVSWEMAAADSVVRRFGESHRALVYDLHYHMHYPQEDPMNAYNPFPPSSRAFNYGNPQAPFAVLNGGVTPEYRYDFSSPGTSPDDEVLKGAAAETPLFDLLLAVDFQSDRLEGVALAVSLTDTFDAYLQLYIVVLEEEVTSYPELSPDGTFRNVVLDMLPSPSGTLLGNSWSTGTEVEQSFSWEYPVYLEDVSDLMVVAFVQDRQEGWILQAEAIRHSPLVGSSPFHADSGALTLYPNPAQDLLTVHFGNLPVRQGSLSIVDISGREVLSTPITPGTGVRELQITHLAEGAYMLFWKEGEVVREHARFIRIR